ncbi:hypothetical protein BV25DRAFT_1843072 [Artomyces pyxidatus]|uniref:Uncharacterized protein n=1 Tax=Artomyces pyxidatus TaxID=48021 RepID=A0ACB8SFK6_9AGAM|nr:hypothetical protein BV25DRAFT_1843072 [Artomyces pyxidatus]
MPPARNLKSYTQAADHPYSTSISGHANPAKNEVIIISDDEDADPIPPAPAHVLDKGKSGSLSDLDIRNLQEEVKRLKDEVDRVEEECFKWRGQLIKSAHDTERLLDKMNAMPRSIPASAFDDIVCCDVCHSLMFFPALLPDCGHTFCQACLIDWFGTIRTAHLNAHPDHNMDLPQQLSGITKPLYTCPTCRAVARARPCTSIVTTKTVELVSRFSQEKEPDGSSGRGERMTSRTDYHELELWRSMRVLSSTGNTTHQPGS